MISTSKPSHCRLAFVSLITNYIFIIFTLLCNYPDLLPYCSLIRVVYLYRQVCVKSAHIIPCNLIVY